MGDSREREDGENEALWHLVRQVVDAIPDVIFVKDRDFRLRLVNRALAESMGLTPWDMEGQPDSTFWPLEVCEGDPATGRRGYHDEDRDALGGAPTQVTERVEMADGQVHIFQTDRYPLTRPDGEPVAVLGYARDITASRLLAERTAELQAANARLEQANAELKTEIGAREAADQRAQQLNASLEERIAARTEALIREVDAHEKAVHALRESEERYQLAIRGARAGVWDWNLETNEVFFSKHFQQLLGMEDGALDPHPQSIWTRMHPDDVDRVQQAIDRHFADPDYRYDLDYRLRHTTGAYRWYHAWGATQRDDGGKPHRMTGSIVDIHEQKLAETRQKRLQAQLGLAHRLQSLGRLAGGVAHDFNNMLMVIQACAEVARLNLPQAHPVGAEVDEILTAVDRASSLTKQLVTFAKQQSVKPRPIDLNAAIAEQITMIRRLVGETVEVVWRPGDDAGTVLLDVGQLSQILINLALNARDAISGQGQLVIATGHRNAEPADAAGEPADEMVVLQVSDDGSGIDRATRASIFEPFFTTKPIGMGTGLGLATVYGIVTQNNGSISVDSELGEGTTFRIELPRHVDQETRGRPDELAPIDRTARPATPRATVLLVDDEPSIVRICARLLESHGFTVLRTTNPHTAAALVRDHPGPIDLLLTDVIMPGMNGKELSELAVAARPEIKVLFMSGYAADIIVRHGVANGEVDYLAKPLSMDRLLTAVRAVLEPSSET